MDLNIVGIFIAILVVLITIGLLFIYKRSKSVHRDVLITGLSGSGKTLLFSMLIYQKAAKTHTSIKENYSKFSTEKGFLNLVDIPGYERLREKYLEQYKKTCRAFIYLIDSISFQRDVRDVAEFLFTIMSDPLIATNCKNVLIFCNKHDNPMAKGAEVIKNQLEKELNLLRNTKANQLVSTDGDDNSSVFLGSRDSEFKFSHYPAKIEFTEGYVYNSDSQPTSNYSDIEKWLLKMC